MSRRRGEFEHRTSIFEGSYRAWSYLGSLDPHVATNLNPSTLESNIVVVLYEPLPKNGLSNPFIMSIITPWLGENVKVEEINSGLSILRTWWQHRRRGESATAIEALSSRRMSAIVMAYTKHFFALAHCLVIEEGEEAPRSLQQKLRTYKLSGVITNPPRGSSSHGGASSSDDTSLLPQAQAQNQQSSAGNPLSEIYDRQTLELAMKSSEVAMKSSICNPSIQNRTNSNMSSAPSLHIPYPSAGPPAMPTHNMPPSADCAHTQNTFSKPVRSILRDSSFSPMGIQRHHSQPVGAEYTQQLSVSTSIPDHDHEEAPIVTMDSAGNHHFALSVQGMEDGHCLKIVETLIRGKGPRSPIDGVLSACASRTCDVGGGVLVRVERLADLEVVGAACVRNLKMIGYRGEVIKMPFPRGIINGIASAGNLAVAENVMAAKAREKMGAGFQLLTSAYDYGGGNIVFDWSLSCTCARGVPEDDTVCPKHSQLNYLFFKEFRIRQDAAKFILSGQTVTACENCGLRDGCNCSTMLHPRGYDVQQFNNNNDQNGYQSSVQAFVNNFESNVRGNEENNKKREALPIVSSEAKRPCHISKYTSMPSESVVAK